MFKRSQSVVGIDAGSYSIKCVEIIPKKDHLELLQASIVPAQGNSPDLLSSTIKNFCSATPGPKKKVRISLSGPSAVVRRITLPIMTHAELKDAIRFEAESHIPFAIDECVLDFQILNQVPNQSMMNVLLVAAKRELIDERLRAFADIGIMPETIDLDVFCLMNAFEFLSERPISESHGLLNIGHKTSLFLIVQQGLPYLVREIPHGGMEVAAALADLKEATAAQAEEPKTLQPAEASEDLRKATQKGFEALADELKNSLEYFENETSEKLTWIGLSGGGAGVFEAEAILSDLLGRRVTRWDNTKKIQPAKSINVELLASHGSELNIALGMAIAGMGKTR